MAKELPTSHNGHSYTMAYKALILYSLHINCLQSFDAVGWAAGRAFGP